MPEMPDPVLAVIGLLNADLDVAALAGVRVFGGEMPESQATAMPVQSVMVTLAGGGAMGVGWQDYTDLRFDVFSYGATREEAARMWRAVHRRLKGFSREIHSQVLLHWARQSGGPIPLIDPDTTWPYIFSSWQLLVSEVPAS